MIALRPFRLGDEPALLAVFRSAIREVAVRDYAPEQIAAWAPDSVDLEAWARRVQGIAPFVAEEGGRLVGYADLQADGYIDHFFVAGDAGGRGVGRQLMARLHERAAELGLASMHSHVSLTAEPFFARYGFGVVERWRPIVRGVALDNALMRKALGPAAA